MGRPPPGDAVPVEGSPADCMLIAETLMPLLRHLICSKQIYGTGRYRFVKRPVFKGFSAHNRHRRGIVFMVNIV